MTHDRYSKRRAILDLDREEGQRSKAGIKKSRLEELHLPSSEKEWVSQIQKREKPRARKMKEEGCSDRKGRRLIP